MSIISKATIADALGIEVCDIPESVYDWGKKQFFIATNLSDVAVSKTYRKIVSNTTNFLKLPNRGIATIDSLVVGTTTVDITIGTNVIINEDSGLITYTGGFSGKVVVGYTIAAYTHNTIYDLLVTLFVLKGMVLFTPQEVHALVRKVQIGKYSRTFGAVEGTLGAYLTTLDMEIGTVKAMALGDDGQMGIGTIT